MQNAVSNSKEEISDEDNSRRREFEEIVQSRILYHQKMMAQNSLQLDGDCPRVEARHLFRDDVSENSLPQFREVLIQEVMDQCKVNPQIQPRLMVSFEKTPSDEAETEKGADGSESNTEELAVKSKSSNKEEKERIRLLTKINQKEDARASSLGPDDVHPVLAFLKSERLDLVMIENMMPEYGMHLLGIHHESIMVQKRRGSGPVRDAFLKALYKMHSTYVRTLEELNPTDETYRDDLLHLSRAVYVSMTVVHDIPENDRSDSEKEAAMSLDLCELAGTDTDDFVALVAKYPLHVLDTMKRLIDEEAKNSGLKKYVKTRDYEEYQKERESHLTFVRSLQKNKDIQHKRWNRLKASLKEAILVHIAELFHAFLLLQTRGKVEYLRRAESRGPYRINPPLDGFQLRWLLEDNPMALFRTYQKWVVQKVVEYDYSDEDAAYHQEAEKCKRLWKRCLTFGKTEWAEFSDEEQKNINEFIPYVYYFIKYKHLEFDPGTPAFYLARKQKKKLRVAAKDIELDEQIVIQKAPPKSTTPSEGPKLEDARKTTSCDNEKCLKLKELYLREINNRTNAEGELKKNKAKMDEWELLKKEEEKWRHEKKRMAKRIKELEEQNSCLTNQEADIKRLREDNEYLKARNEKLESDNKKAKEEQSESKAVLDETTRKLDNLRDCVKKINHSMENILHENQRLNGPTTLRNTEPVVKLRDLQKQRAEFEPEKIVEGFRRMGRKLYKKTPEVEVLMEMEQRRLEEAIELYSRILDYNIRSIQTTHSNIGLLPVPLVPGVSARFLAKFHEEFEKLIGCAACYEKTPDGERKYVCANWKGHVLCFKCGEEWKSPKDGRVMCPLRCQVEMVLGT